MRKTRNQQLPLAEATADHPKAKELSKILESLQSKDTELKYQAIQAAGNWGIAESWPDISDVLSNQDADTNLLLAAIDAAVKIGHHDAMAVLSELFDRSSDNDDIIDAVHEALAMLDELF